ncbi:hypothetical protein ACJZ2D_006474 [Fusarium nematophilum]
MAPADFSAAGCRRQISAIIEFSRDLLSKLPTSCDSSLANTLLTDLTNRITAVKGLSQASFTIPPPIVKDLKDVGRKLWNRCIRERRRRDDVLTSPSRSRLLVQMRVFAFLVHVLAREGSGAKREDTEEEIAYMADLALTLMRVCIEESELDGARLGESRAADYVGRLKLVNQGVADSPQQRRREAKYFTMRCALSKADEVLRNLDSASAEQLADTFEHIGSSLSSKGDHNAALKWLRRAHTVISAQEIERLSTGGLELRMSIYHDLIQTLLEMGSPENVEEADNLVSLLPCGNADWIGKTVVRRAWMGTMEAEDSNAPTELIQLLERIFGDVGPCSADVTAAVHSLLWKKLDTTYTKKQYKASELWCQAALHRIFSNSGEASKGKFGRRLMLCAISCSDMEATQSAFYSLPKTVQDDPLTREAQHVGDKICTLAALKAATEAFSSGDSSVANLPAALRCTIRLIHSIETEGSEGGGQVPEHVEDLCNAFEKAAEHAKQGLRDEHGNKVFTVAELEWFRKNAYNVGEACREEVADQDLMAMRCHFVLAASCVSQARTEDKVNEQLQRYMEARQHVAAFDELLEGHFRDSNSSSRDDQVVTDMMGKLSALFVFDFEGAICLKSWDDLGQIIRKAKACKDDLMYKAMGDFVYATMRLIINEIFALEQFDSQKLAKYMHCMYQAILPLDDSLALQVVEQALQIAREGSQTDIGCAMQMQRPFPAEELDWIITTTFNHAIDVFSRGDKALCECWALKALELAEHMQDGGDMRDLLRERVVKLGFSPRVDHDG